MENETLITEAENLGEPMKYKIYYTSEGWICERYPYYFEIEDESRYIEVSEDVYNSTCVIPDNYSFKVSDDGELSLQVYDQAGLDKVALESELTELEHWFDYYDTQSIQYARDMRLFGESKIDMAALDNLAIERAARIKEIRTAIAE